MVKDSFFFLHPKIYSIIYDRHSKYTYSKEIKYQAKKVKKLNIKQKR